MEMFARSLRFTSLHSEHFEKSHTFTVKMVKLTLIELERDFAVFAPKKLTLSPLFQRVKFVRCCSCPLNLNSEIQSRTLPSCFRTPHSLRR